MARSISITEAARVEALMQAGRLLTDALAGFERRPDRSHSRLGLVVPVRHGPVLEIEVVVRPGIAPGGPTLLLSGPEKEPA